MPLSVISMNVIEENAIPVTDMLRRVLRISQTAGGTASPVFASLGVGKTCSIMNVLTLYLQVIVHTEYRGVPFLLHQLVWLLLIAHDGSTKGLCQRILQEMDRIRVSLLNAIFLQPDQQGSASWRPCAGD